MATPLDTIFRLSLRVLPQKDVAISERSNTHAHFSGHNPPPVIASSSAEERGNLGKE